MGRDYFYKPGSWYRLDDRSGFRVRAERTKKQWDNLIVRDLSWEARHPQDFVKGVRDDQTVPEARPRPAYTLTGNSQSTLSASAVYGQNYLFINSPFAFKNLDQIGITLDSDLGIVFLTTIYYGDFNSDFSSDFALGPTFASFPLGSFPAGSIAINPGLPGSASSGNWVCNFSSPQVQPQNYPGSASGAGGGDG